MQRLHEQRPQFRLSRPAMGCWLIGDRSVRLCPHHCRILCTKSLSPSRTLIHRDISQSGTGDCAISTIYRAKCGLESSLITSSVSPPRIMEINLQYERIAEMEADGHDENVFSIEGAAAPALPSGDGMLYQQPMMDENIDDIFLQQPPQQPPPRPLPKLTAQVFNSTNSAGNLKTSIPIPLPVPVPIPFVDEIPETARSGEISEALRLRRDAAEKSFRALDFQRASRDEMKEVVDSMVESLSQFHSLEDAIPRYFKLGLLVWTTMTNADVLKIRQAFTRAHADVSSRVKTLDEYMHASFRPPIPATVNAFVDGSWSYLVECYTRYQCEFEVDTNAVCPQQARLRPMYRRTDLSRPQNAILENVKARLTFEIERLLHDRDGEVDLDYYVCSIFSVALTLISSDIGMENLMSKDLQDELDQIKFAIDFCFEHPKTRVKLQQHHIRMMLGAIILLRSGLNLPRPVHRPVVPAKALMLQMRGFKGLSSSIRLLYRPAEQQVDYTPCRPELVDDVLKSFFDHILSRRESNSR